MTERQRHLDDLKYIGNLAKQYGSDELLQFIIDTYNEVHKEEEGIKLPWD